jgi:hypothetical protein
MKRGLVYSKHTVIKIHSPSSKPNH